MTHDAATHVGDELRQRVEVTLLPSLGDDMTIIEWQQRGTRFHERLAPSWSAARAWVEGHYEDVRWRNDLRGSALIGAFATGDHPMEDD